MNITLACEERGGIREVIGWMQSLYVGMASKCNQGAITTELESLS